MIIGRNYQKILKKVLKRIKPRKNEQKKDDKFIGGFVKKLNEITPRDIQIELAGSTARETNLRGDRDFDVFILFPRDYSVKDLTKFGLEWAKKMVAGNRYEIAYAEHPYLRAWVEGREIDMVPSYKISTATERMTAVDRSPLHTSYILANIQEKQKDEVRLLKQFLKGMGTYGAEGKIRGFSGYLCELLIIVHGSFLDLIDQASRWGEIPVFNPEGAENKVQLRKRFPDAAMIFIDPVDEKRNVAAAVSKTSLSLFIHSARKFLKKPSTRFFFPPVYRVDMKWMKKQLKGRDSKIFAIEFDKPDVVEDILWPQLYKFMSKTTERAKDNDFSIFDSDVIEEEGKCVVLFEFQIFKLPKIKKISGPPLWFREEVKDFMKKHKVVEPIWFENERILSLGERKFTKAGELLQDIMEKPGPYGVPPDLTKIISKGKLLKINKIINKYPKFLFAYLKKRNID